MESDVRQAVLKLKDRADKPGTKSSNWVPNRDDCICNVHFVDHISPSRTDKMRFPVKESFLTSISVNRGSGSNYYSKPRKSFAIPRVERMYKRRKREAATATSLADVETGLGHVDTESNSTFEPEQSDNETSLSERSVKTSTSEISVQTCDPGEILSGSGDDRTSSRSDEMTPRWRRPRNSLLLEIEKLHEEKHRLEELLHSSEEKRSPVTDAVMKNIKFHTGIASVEIFNALYNWIEPFANKLELSGLSMSCKDKVVVTLIRLRLGLFQTDLACRWGVSQGQISKILEKWVPFLARQLEQLIMWPTSLKGPTGGLYDHFPNTVAIIDCFEIFIERPKNLTIQKAMWSEYKHHQTVKYLIAVDPNTGCIVFISKGFSGSCSDHFVVEHSGILNSIRDGQRIMADRGFTIRDLVARKRAFLEIPSVLKGKSQLSSAESLQSRALAACRIHVER